MATEPQAQTQTQVPELGPQIELTINTKPTEPAEDKNGTTECTCGAKSKPLKLDRKDTIESFFSEPDDDYVSRHERRRYRPERRYSISPSRIRSRPPPVPITTMVGSSTQLLSKVSTYDGIADVPFPGRSSFYLTTYPFTDRDVKKWAWLFSLGIEDTFLTEVSRSGPTNPDDMEDDDFRHTYRYPGADVVRPRRRDRSPFYDPVTTDIPSVYLSRALDANVVPDDTDKKLRFLVVVQNRARPAGAKLMVAESRKAAGIIMYYEALVGNSIMFVGATADQWKGGRKKMKRVESLEEIKAEDVVGIIC